MKLNPKKNFISLVNYKYSFFTTYKGKYHVDNNLNRHSKKNPLKLINIKNNIIILYFLEVSERKYIKILDFHLSLEVSKSRIPS